MTPARSRLTFLYAALFVVSGACGLTYEVVWTRQLVQVFGVTAFAVTTVLVSFMGGMALGAAVLGRRADRARRPLRMFALLEGGVGAYALALPILLSGVDLAYGALVPALPESFLLRSTVRFAFCVLLLIVPTMLMGATLPALGRGLLRDRGKVGLGVGVLYFVNTLGAAAGCFLAGFELIPRLGLRNTTLLAAALNGAVAATAWILDRRAEEGAAEPPTPPVAEPVAWTSPPWWPLVVAFGSGMTALGFEVVWFRILVQVFGSTVYSFSAMLTCFLLGLALGSVLIGPIADRWRHPVRLLAATQGAVGLFALLGMLAVNAMPQLFLRAIYAFGLDFAGMNRTKFVFSLVTLVPPAIAFGATFPVAVRLTPKGRGTGARIGRVYAWNTLGAILGSFGAGFILLPSIGTEWTLRLVVLASLLLATGSVLAEPGPIRPRFAFPAGAALMIAIACLLLAPRWNVRLLSAGLYFDPSRYIDASGRISIDPIIGDYQVITHDEGYNDTITSFQSVKGKFITVNGSTTASDQFEDMFSQRMLGHLPMALHPGPVGKACIVGLGAGVTTGAVALYEVDKVVAVELERGVFAASRFFRKENHDVLSNPVVDVRIDDGRNYLKLTHERFDVISSAANFPSLTGSGALFGRGYFELCRERLAPGGVMCQFAPLWRIEGEDVRTIVGSFVDVFPHVRVFSTGLSLVMLGREEPWPPVDMPEISRRVARPQVAASLREVGVRGPVELVSYYAFDETGARRFAGDAPRDTDDRPRIEFYAPRGLFSNSVGPNLEAVRALRPSREERAAQLSISPVDAPSFLTLARGYDDAVDGSILLSEGKLGTAVAALLPPGEAGNRYAGYLIAEYSERAGLELQAAGRLDEAKTQFSNALRFEPDRHDSLVGLGYVDLFVGTVDEAEPLLVKAVALYPRSAGAAYRLGAVRELQGKLAEAESLYRKAIDLNPNLSTPYALLGNVTLRDGRAAAALAYLDRGIALGERTEGALVARAAALFALGRRREALGRAREIVAAYPYSADGLELLARAAESEGRAEEATSARSRLREVKGEDERPVPR
ncbi:MAG TPA: fused MFS/spermidine synthase [Candidatus Polarisedimenticolaceae bacterium]|nr:fused MFS/spermidine synthase [Candidatus Polarisedimenticolaceae bacterium]